MAFWAMVGGIVGALLAALPGFLDFLTLTERRTWRIAAIHMGLNLTIVALYVVNLWLRTQMAPGVGLPISLWAIAVALLLVSGWLGGTLVYERGVAIDPAPDVTIITQRKRHAA